MPLDDFQKVTKLADAFQRAQLDHHLNLDRAGINAGQMVRVRHDNVTITPEQKKAKEGFANLVLELNLRDLLNDPVYRKRWEEFGTFLADYSAAAQTALERAMEIAEAAHEAVERSLENAHRLDGKAVFETDDGRFVYADGAEIAPDAYGRIARNPNANTYAEHLLLIEAAANADAAVAKTKDYQARLNAAEARRHDPDNHYKSTDEMDAEQHRIEETAPDAVQHVLKESAAFEISSNQPSSFGSLNLRE